MSGPFFATRCQPEPAVRRSRMEYLRSLFGNQLKMRITKDNLLRLGKNLTASDLLTCIALWTHSSGRIVSGVHQDTLSASVGLSTRTLQRSLHNLRRKGLVTVEMRYRSPGEGSGLAGYDYYLKW